MKTITLSLRLPTSKSEVTQSLGDAVAKSRLAASGVLWVGSELLLRAAHRIAPRRLDPFADLPPAGTVFPTNPDVVTK